MPTQSPLATLFHGFVGMLGSAVAYLATVLQDIETWLRLLSIGAGLIVAILTIVKLLRDLRKK